MQEYRVTWTHSVPSIAGLLLRGNPEKYDLRSVKFIALMGTSVPVSFLRELERLIPSAVALQGYGLTETSPLLTLAPPRGEEREIGSIGKALPGAEIRLVDEHGNDVPLDEPGELIVRGPKVFSGYYGNPELTARVIPGWLVSHKGCGQTGQGRLLLSSWPVGRSHHHRRPQRLPCRSGGGSGAVPARQGSRGVCRAGRQPGTSDRNGRLSL